MWNCARWPRCVLILAVLSQSLLAGSCVERADDFSSSEIWQDVPAADVQNGRADTNSVDGSLGDDSSGDDSDAGYDSVEEDSWTPPEPDGWGDGVDQMDFWEPDTGLTDPDVFPGGLCTVGDSGGWVAVRIRDDLTNSTLVAGGASGCQSGNPGADIDAIAIDRVGNVVAWASAVLDVELWMDATCGNDKDDPDQVLGPQDGVAGGGVFTGYYSLNGGAITVEFDDGEEMLCGDIIYVVEMYSGSPGDQEKYMVYVGASADGPWYEVAMDCTGPFEAEVIWEW